MCPIHVQDKDFQMKTEKDLELVNMKGSVLCVHVTSKWHLNSFHILESLWPMQIFHSTFHCYFVLTKNDPKTATHGTCHPWR
jgi:hypothetical protein